MANGKLFDINIAKFLKQAWAELHQAQFKSRLHLLAGK